MSAADVVNWFHRGAARGTAPSADCGAARPDGGRLSVVVRRSPDRAIPDRGHRDRWPDIADAIRAGTWGDGGRDH